MFQTRVMPLTSWNVAFGGAYPLLTESFGRASRVRAAALHLA